jgi:hypothetical protein
VRCGPRAEDHVETRLPVGPPAGGRQLDGALGVSFALVTLSVLMAGPVRAAGEPSPTRLLRRHSATFSREQIEQLVAPIALYPDGLSVQLLMLCPPRI